MQSMAMAGPSVDGTPDDPNTILIAIDESSHSFYALQWALHTLVSPTRHDKLILIHAKLPLTAVGGGPGYILTAEVVLTASKAQDRVIESFMQKALQLCEEKKIVADVRIETGDPRDVICELAETLKASFLVLGSHGYGAIKRAVLGSVSDYCAHHAKCPVVIVKKPHKISENQQHSNE